MRDNRLMDGQITPFETDFQPYLDKMGVCMCVCVWGGGGGGGRGKMLMKRCVQWNLVCNWKNFRLQRVSNPESLGQ